MPEKRKFIDSSDETADESFASHIAASEKTVDHLNDLKKNELAKAEMQASKEQKTYDKYPIIVRKMIKKFSKKSIVGPINFAVKKGHVAALLGRSGSGKSVTLNAVVGAIKGFEGDIIIRGISRKTFNNHIANQEVGFYTQMEFSLQRMSCFDFLKNICLTFGINPQEISSRIEKWMKILDLWNDRDKALSDYSWGMKNRVNFLLCFIKEPKVLLLDEPGANLDGVWRYKIKKILKSFVTTGSTVLVTVHNIDEMVDIIDDFIIINDGKMAFAGTKDELNLYRKYKIVVANFKELQEENVKRFYEQNGYHWLTWNEWEGSFTISANTIGQVNNLYFMFIKLGIVVWELIKLPIDMSALEKALRGQGINITLDKNPIDVVEQKRLEKIAAKEQKKLAKQKKHDEKLAKKPPDDNGIKTQPIKQDSNEQ